MLFRSGSGANLMTYTAQSLYLPHWFVRRRGLAISIAFAGVGVGALLLLPWLQDVIDREGWKAASVLLGLLVVFVLGPLNLFVHRRPEDLGLLPDGDKNNSSVEAKRYIADKAWASIEWTLGRAVRTRRFWWIVLAYF